MTYAAKQDLIDRYGNGEIVQLADRTNVPPTTIDDTIVNRALEDADATINGYLAARYTLPLSSVPPLVKRLACEIARYHLYEEAAPERVQRAYEAAIKLLQDISKGVASLGLDAAGTDPVPSTGGEPVFTDTERTFTRDTLADF
ncbi:MAG: hypothetical protein FLDDKLPJ_00930 [Phycisphaerae bacterium]|nr:hypothetical protein [Phycisphaerae bacterium]